MYHSITFKPLDATTPKNTWTDWHMIPSSRPLFNPPPVKTKYIDIPGADGDFDISTLLTGRPVYGNRTGSFEFILTKYDVSWVKTYSDIQAYLHGKHLRATLEDDPLYFYEGRFAVAQWDSAADYSRITINYNVLPFKKLVSSPTSGGIL